MNKWVTTLVGLAVVALAVWLVAKDYQPVTPIGHAVERPESIVDGGAPKDAAPSAATAAAAPDDAGPLLLSDLVAAESDRRGRGGIGSTMLDGTPVPPLPASTPREVRFGVVLVSYTGAQPSVVGGRIPSRSRDDAKALAAKLLATAQTDFHAAVQQGDAGSADDVGRVKLGILEPAPEYVLFTLAAGGVGGPIDTPRGYWIVKRLD
ncbi:MAG TPA: peptidyl-prolyl cis-trans isomerase [Polyangiaceae bacterium]|jgi:hypothetical protein|nr:peptidyl-prolyl cis-trans isomerase [Polyangiaceae bacterium]